MLDVFLRALRAVKDIGALLMANVSKYSSGARLTSHPKFPSFTKVLIAFASLWLVEKTSNIYHPP